MKKPPAVSIKGAFLVALPPLVFILFFYSLAAHMYLSLGGWPRSIGKAGFSHALSAHAAAQYGWFSVVVGLSVYVWPVAVVALAVVAKGRRYLPYPGIYALAVLVCYLLMQVAPEPFLYWWLD